MQSGRSELANGARAEKLLFRAVQSAKTPHVATIDADESTSEAIGDWHYWVARSYCF